MKKHKGSWALLEGRLLAIYAGLERVIKDTPVTQLAICSELGEARKSLETAFRIASGKRQEEETKI